MKKLFFVTLSFILFFSNCNINDNNIPFNSPLIVLTFDDGSESIYKLAFTEMQKYNYPGVNFIPSGWIDVPGYLTLEEMKELENAGWETGGHSVTHANLTTIPIDSARAEIRKNYEYLIQHNLKHRCFALPSGHSNIEVDAIIKEYFEIIRTSYNERYYYPLNTDRLGYYQVEDNDDANSLLSRVNHGIIESECLIIFGFHSFTNDEPNSIANIRFSVFKEFLEELKKLNVEVATLSEAVDRLK
ncbi:MAG: hypothetical protein STSR0008_05710 [Ignavibacterium sp.]